MKKAKEQNHEGEKQNAKKSALGSLSVEKHYFPWTFSTGRDMAFFLLISTLQDTELFDPG